MVEIVRAYEPVGVTRTEPPRQHEDLWRWLEMLAEESERVRREEGQADQWAGLLDLYRGKHWPAIMPTYKPPVVANELHTLILQDASELTDSQPRIFVMKDPRRGNRDLEAERALRAVWVNQQIDLKLIYAIVWARIIGTSFLYRWWDPDGAHGQGDVAVDMLDARSVLPDPDALDDRKWTYRIIRQVMDLTEIQRLFPISGMTVKPEDRWSVKDPRAKNIESPQSTAYIGPLYGGQSLVRGSIYGYKKARAQVIDFIGIDNRIEETVEEVTDPVTQAVVMDPATGLPRLRYLRKAKYPHGRRIVGANGHILYDGDNTNPGGDYGLVRVVLEPAVDSFWGGGFVHQTGELQLAADKLLSGTVENNIRLNNGFVLSTTNTGLDWECVVPDQEVRRADGTFARADALHIGDQVIGYEEGRPVVDIVLGVASRGVQPCVRVRTDHGRVLRVSGTHPFLVENQWRRADALVVGDVLTVSTPLGFGSTLTRPTATLLGYLVADGCFTARSAASITKRDPDVRDDIQRSVEVHGGALHEGSRSDHFRIVGMQPFLREHHLVGTRAATKRVPPSVMQGDRDIIAAFLAAYLDCDGHFHTFKNDVTSYTTSERLAADVQELWWRLGVHAVVWPSRRLYRERPYTTWFVKVTNRHDALRVLDMIEPRLISKKNVLKAARMRQRILATQDAPGRNRRTEERVAAIEPIGAHATITIETARTHTVVVEGVVTHNSFAGIPAQIVQINPGSTFDIKYPPPMPADMIQAPYRMLDLQRRVLGFPASRVGEGGRGNVSPELTETEISQAQATTRLSAKLLYSSISRLAEMIFASMAQGYTTERVIPAVEGESFKPVVWKPLQDPERYATYVDPASFTVMSRTMLRRLGMALYRLRAIDRRALLEQVGWPDWEQTAQRLDQSEMLAAMAKMKGKKR